MSFQNIETDNINLATINYVPWAPGGEGSKGALNNVNVSDGAGGFNASTYSISGQQLLTTANLVLVSQTGAICNSTLYGLPTAAPASNSQVLTVANSSATPPTTAWANPPLTVLNNATVISDSTNPAAAAVYILTTFNATPVPGLAVTEPILTFPLISGKSYTLTITAATTGTPFIGAGTCTIGVCTNTYTGVAGSGAINYGSSLVAGAAINIGTASFGAGTGLTSSITFTASTSSNLGGIYFYIPLATTWTVGTLMNISVLLVQNN